MSINISEWLNLIFRWSHVFSAILWVGSTYYFTWLDGRMKKTGDAPVWMVHSGGFYLVGKQTNPKIDVSKLHWFRFEALLTWLSGLVLLGLVYYHGGLMDDSAVAPGAAICYVALVAMAYGLTQLFNGRAAYITSAR